MIRTLFQHEFLRTRGLIAGIFGIDVLLALVGFAMAVSRLPLLSTVGAMSLLTAAMVLTPAVIFGLGYEHWRSSFTGRGYLTHSLPVRGSTQALVKLGHAYLWTVLAVVVSLLLGLLVMLARAVEVGPRWVPSLTSCAWG